jgi:hypothetical protein
MSSLDRIPFMFNNNITTIEIAKLDDGRIFFNASELWDMNGRPAAYTVEAYIKADQTKELMLYCYLKNQSLDNIRTVIKQIRREIQSGKRQLESLSDYIDVSLIKAESDDSLLTVDDVRDLFNSSQGNLSKIERHFVNAAEKDKDSLYYIDRTLFLDYSMRLSIQLKSQILNVFQKYGWLEGLAKEDRIDGLFSLIDAEKESNE